MCVLVTRTHRVVKNIALTCYLMYFNMLVLVAVLTNLLVPGRDSMEMMTVRDRPVI